MSEAQKTPTAEEVMIAAKVLRFLADNLSQNRGWIWNLFNAYKCRELLRLASLLEAIVAAGDELDRKQGQS